MLFGVYFGWFGLAWLLPCFSICCTGFLLVLLAGAAVWRVGILLGAPAVVVLAGAAVVCSCCQLVLLLPAASVVWFASVGVLGSWV